MLGCIGENNSLSISTLLQKELIHEFRELRATVERMGLMKANPVFFLLYLLHILLLDIAAWLTLWLFGTSLVPFLLCSVLLSIVQVRALPHPASVGCRAGLVVLNSLNIFLSVKIFGFSLECE